MTEFRAYRNGDSPALAELWSRLMPPRNVVRPLSAHEFDALVPSRLGLDRHGLTVALRGGRPVGFAHAGFGPREPQGPSHELDYSMGSVVMLAVEEADAEAAAGLLAASEAYLRGRGAQVIYAGGQYPLNPFYWGIYGGSEFAGVLDGHLAFHNAVLAAGFEGVAGSILFEARLDQAEPRDPRIAPVRRQYRLEVDEDALPPGWWDALAIGLFHPTRLELVDRQNGRVGATAWTWEIAPNMAVEDGLARIGMIRMEVHPDLRRRGLGRTLILECFRHARDNAGDVLCAQTDANNLPAIHLYHSLGFEPVENATLYRMPAGKTLL